MLKPLTTLRFVAAMLVFIWHVDLYVAPFLPAGLNLGYAGVSFFFMLSGFILTYVYHQRLARPSWPQTLGFYGARFAKIYPTHLLMLAAACLLLLAQHELINRSWLVSNLLLLQAWLPEYEAHFSFNAPAWSISVELFFYALFPLLLAALWWLRDRLGAGPLVAIMAGWWLITSLLILPFMGRADELQYGLYVWPVQRLGEFAAGMVLGSLFVAQRSKAIGGTAAELAVSGLAIAGLIASMSVPTAFTYGLYWLPLSALVIYVFAAGGGRISAVLSRRWAIYLGEISFAFYMVHWLVIGYLNLAGWPPVVTASAALILSLALSAALYHLYEQPWRRLIRAGARRLSALGSRAQRRRH